MSDSAIRTAQKQWEENILRDWLETYGERRKEFSAYERAVPVKTVYTPLDMADQEIDFLKDIGFPGEYPYTRGNEPNMYRRKFWEMSQYSGFGSA